MASSLKPSFDPYRAIVEGTIEYVLCLLDPDGVVRTWNPGGERIFGYPREEIVGRQFAVLHRRDDCAGGIPDADLKVAAGCGQVSIRRSFLRKSGTEFCAEGMLTAVRDGSSLVGFTCVLRDASERCRLERAVEQSNEELQRFAFAVSHDLQEPLRNTRNYAELLAKRYKGRLDQDADEFIRYVVEGVNRMSQLLKDVLAYSQAGREDRTHPEPAQAGSVLQWALMNVDGQVKETGASVTYDTLPVVRVDPAQLATVFQHLIGNSLKFRSECAPHVHIFAHPAAEAMWEFSVSDNGVGVAPEHTERIFGVFKRLHGREVPGTGVGLAICRKIIQAHGGRIWMESETGQGATVKFTLPGA